MCISCVFVYVFFFMCEKIDNKDRQGRENVVENEFVISFAKKQPQ